MAVSWYATCKKSSMAQCHDIYGMSLDGKQCAHADIFKWHQFLFKKCPPLFMV